MGGDSPGRRVLRSVAGAAQRGGLRRVPWRRRASARYAPRMGAPIAAAGAVESGGARSAVSRASMNAAARGGARTHIRCASSCGCRTSRRSLIIRGCRARSRLPARGARAVLRPCPRSRRHAGLAARTGEYPQALPDPCRRLQSRRLDARAARVRGRRERPHRPAPPLFSSCQPAISWFSGCSPLSKPNPPRSPSPSASRQAQTEISAPPQRAGKRLGKYQFAAAWGEVKGNNGNRRKRSGAKAETFGCFKKEAGEKTRVSASSGNT